MREIKQISKNLSTWADLDNRPVLKIEINRYHGFNDIDELLLRDLLYALVLRKIDFSVTTTNIETLVVEMKSIDYSNIAELNAEIVKTLKGLTVCKALLY